jgi:hypothetical protein
MEQLGQGVVAAYKEETTFATPPAVATGYSRIRFSRSPGLAQTSADIDPTEVRDDGKTKNARKGSNDVRGSFGGAVYQGAWVDFLAMAMRTSGPVADVLKNELADPVDRSITVEQYYKQKDGSKQFPGVRLAGFTFRLTPDGEAFYEFPMVGFGGMNILTGAGAPAYTAPLTQNTRPALTSIDAAIQLDGVAVTKLTGIEFTYDNGAAGLKVVGGRNSPNVWPRGATIRGRFTMPTSDFLDEQKVLSEEEFAIVIALAEPAGGPGSHVITLPVSKILNAEEALGDEGALLTTFPFSAGIDELDARKTMISILDESTV